MALFEPSLFESSIFSSSLFDSGVSEGAAVWSPSLVFADATDGVWADPSDSATLFTDTAAATPSTVDGPVRRVNDKSGNANHLLAPADANRPTFRQSVGGLRYLEFIAANADELRVDLGAFSQTFTCVVAVDGLPPQVQQHIIGQYGTVGNRRGWRIRNHPTSAGVSLQYSENGAAYVEGAPAAPTNRVFTVRAQPGNVQFYANGAQVATYAATIYAGASAILTIGDGEDFTAQSLTGNLYKAVFVRKWLSDDERQQLEAYAAASAGVTF